MTRPDSLERTLHGLVDSLELVLAVLDEYGVHAAAKHVDAAIVQLHRELETVSRQKQRAA